LPRKGKKDVFQFSVFMFLQSALELSTAKEEIKKLQTRELKTERRPGIKVSQLFWNDGELATFELVRELPRPYRSKWRVQTEPQMMLWYQGAAQSG
jgi:hypothetical protein